MARWSFGLLAGCLVAGCGESSGSQGDAADSGGSVWSSGAGGGFVVPPPSDADLNLPTTVSCAGPCTDFPTTPVVDAPDAGPAVPDDVATLFAPTDGTSPGPCILDPEPDSLFPRNWLRPRVHWAPVGGETLFEVRIHNDRESNDLVAYTANTTWKMPRSVWKALSSRIGEEWTLTISVRGLNAASAGAKPTLASTVAVKVAPAEAKGSIVYWTTSGVSSLKGFKVGDESVVQALLPSQVQQTAATCVGCHTSTPDGQFAGFTIQENGWSNALASLAPASVGRSPAFLGAGAVQSLAQSGLGIQTFSKGHWTDGDHVEIAQIGNGAGALAWFNLEAQVTGQGYAWGILARNGDPRGAGAPSWNHAGDTIVYVSLNADQDGRLANGPADLYTVPYQDKKGGNAAPVPGASDPNVMEYYPIYSPDDAFIAFDEAPLGDSMYDNASAEVYVIPAGGGAAERLVANTPPACSSKVSPGVTNSWPKWSPFATAIGDRTYYWLIFSSKRGESGNPQLYVTGVVKTPDGLESHGALYLWNQPDGENNHTPVWDNIDIPEVPPPPDVH